MRFRLNRLDGKKDNLTQEIFNSFDEAYNYLKDFYGDECCSDSDIENKVYYDIVKDFED